MKLSWLILDDSGEPVTNAAASTAIKFRRLSDGYLLDWNDLIFKNSGWIAVSSPMTEIDSVNLPGWYEKIVVETSWSDGKYQALTNFDDGSVKRFGGLEFEVKNGSEVFVGNLSSLSVDDVIKADWCKAVINKETGTFTVYALDGVTPLVTGTIEISETQSERLPD